MIFNFVYMIKLGIAKILKISKTEQKTTKLFPEVFKVFSVIIYRKVYIFMVTGEYLKSKIAYVWQINIFLNFHIRFLEQNINSFRPNYLSYFVNFYHVVWSFDRI